MDPANVQTTAATNRRVRFETAGFNQDKFLTLTVLIRTNALD